MALDPDKALDAAANSAITAIGGHVPNVVDYLTEVKSSHVQRLKLIMGFYENKKIDEDDFKEKLNQEEVTYKLQLDSSEFQNKAVLQVALNAFINGLYSAVVSAIKIA